MKKTVIFIILIFLLSISIFSISKNNALDGIVIVLDAGHGGMDQGTKYFGIDEAKINLEIVKKLEKKLKQYGCVVVLTRTNENDLSNDSINKKREDMKNRIQIINDEKNDLLISIHMNSYQNENVQGLHVFYKNDSSSSKQIANILQKHANLSLNQDKSIKQGNFYILNNSRIPSVLIECGFLSNSIDRQNLVHDQYQNKVVDSIVVSILEFYENII